MICRRVLDWEDVTLTCWHIFDRKHIPSDQIGKQSYGKDVEMIRAHTVHQNLKSHVQKHACVFVMCVIICSPLRVCSWMLQRARPTDNFFIRLHDVDAANLNAKS